MKDWGLRLSNIDPDNLPKLFFLHVNGLAVTAGVCIFLREILGYLQYAVAISFPFSFQKNRFDLTAILLGYCLILFGYLSKESRKAAYVFAALSLAVFLLLPLLLFLLGLKAPLVLPGEILVISSPFGGARHLFTVDIFFCLLILIKPAFLKKWETVRLSPTRLKTGLSLMWLAGSIALVMSTLDMILSGYPPLYSGDVWNEMVWLYAYYAGKARLSDLWLLFSNEHCIFFPRLFFLVDLFLFKANNAFLIPMTLVIQTITFALFGAETWRNPRFSRPLGYFLSGVFLMLLFSAGQWKNFIEGYQIQFVMVYTGAIAAVIFTARYGLPYPSELKNRKWLICALASAVVATFSMVNGIFVWPLLLLMCFMLKMSRRDIITVALSALLVTALFIWMSYDVFGIAKIGYPFGFGGDKTSSFAPDKVWRAPVYFAFFLGLPFSSSAQAASKIGMLGIVLATILGLSFLPRLNRLDRFECISLMVICYIVFTGMAIAVGRCQLGPPQSRYITPASIFWASLLPLLLHEALTISRSRISKLLIPIIIFGIAGLFGRFLLNVHSQRMVQDRRSNSKTLREVSREIKIKREIAGIAIATGVYDPNALRALVSSPKRLPPLAPMMRAHNLSIFKYDWAHLLGQKLDSVCDVSRSGNHSGAFEAIRLIPAAEGEAYLEWRHRVELPAWRCNEGVFVSGWAWDWHAQETPRLIFLTDDDERICGFAIPFKKRPDLEKKYGIPEGELAGWAGYAGCERAGRIRACVLAADGSSAYALPGLYDADEHVLILGK